jgi:hypothetical protein
VEGEMKPSSPMPPPETAGCPPLTMLDLHPDRVPQPKATSAFIVVITVLENKIKKCKNMLLRARKSEHKN